MNKFIFHAWRIAIASVALALVQAASAQTSYRISTAAGGGPPDGILATDLPIGGGWMATDPIGTLYVSATFSSRIYKVDIAGRISTFAGNGVPGYSGDGGPAINAQLEYPGPLTIDGQGNMYFADLVCRFTKR